MAEPMLERIYILMNDEELIYPKYKKFYLWFCWFSDLADP
jgi:hypothetical protein